MSTTTKHTPGPWFTCPQTKRPHNHALVGIGNGAVHVGYVSVTPAMSPAEAEANAALIAAAPAMLAALEAVERDCIATPSSLGMERNQRSYAALQAVRAAISAAKGASL